jgi:hypothetical protein
MREDSAHARNHDLSAAAEILANGTHFLNTLRSYQNSLIDGYFLVGKGGRCLRLTTLSPSCYDYLEILGASVQAGNGISLPFRYLQHCALIVSIR